MRVAFTPASRRASTQVTTQAATADRRQGDRIQVGGDAVVTVLGASEFVLQGTLKNVGEGGTQLVLDEYVSPSSLVKIEFGDDLLLGEVVYCVADQAKWLIGVKVEHGLFGLARLADSVRHWT